MKKFISILFVLVLVCSFSLMTAVPAGANGAPNPTFATIDRATGTTPSEQISIGWERNPDIAGDSYSAPDAIRVTTSEATWDYAMVIVPTEFAFSSTIPISYWGYTKGGNVKAPDEIFLFLDTGDDGAFDTLLTSHKPGPDASLWYNSWHEWNSTDTTEPLNKWHIVDPPTNPYKEVQLADYIDKDYTVLAIALTAGPSTISGPVNVDVYFDQLTVNGDIILDNDTGFIDVPVPFPGQLAPCIQDAIDAALPGTTIIVAAGTYYETIDVTKDDLTIQSLSGDPLDTIIDGTGITGTVVTITGRSGVTISGFTLKGTGEYSSGIYMENSFGCSVSTAAITGTFYGISLKDADGNDFNSVTISNTIANGVNMFGSSGNSFTSVTVSDITNMESGTVWGLLISDGSNENTFDLTTISDLTNEANTKGIHIYKSSGNSFTNSEIFNIKCTGQSATGIDVYNNCNENTFTSTKISHIVAEVSLAGYGSYATGIRVTYYSNDNSFEFTEISDITATDVDGRGVAIYHLRGARNNFQTIAISNIAGGTQGGWGIALYYPECQDNTFSGYHISGLTGANNYGINIRGGANSNSFTGGSISGADCGVYVEGDCPSNSIHYTNIVGSTEYGAYSDTVALDATSNWWGDDQGSEHASNPRTTIGDIVSDNVIFLPWLGASGGQVCNAAQNESTDEWYFTIQDAIDAALPGTTIDVAAGTYDEQVVIANPLTLRGPNAGISPNTGSRVAEAVITGVSPLVNLPSGADVNPLTIEGFTFQDATHPGGSRGGVIFANGESDGWGNVTIRSNRFMNNYGPAIGVWASGSVNSAGWTITDNLIDGVTGGSRSGIYLDMDLDPYTLTGWEISLNTIRNTAYGGIMVDDAVDMVISGNIIEDVQKTGIQPSGVSQNVTITGNVITRANLAYEENPRAGIRLYGVDPEDEYEGAGNLIGPVWVTNNTVTDSYIGFEIKDGHDITGKEVHVNFNNFTLNSEAGLRHGGTGLLDATNNWWGTKAKGLIEKMVSGNVDFDPWIGAGVKNSKSKKTGTTDETVDATTEADTKVVKKGKGKPNITVTEYEDNPGDGAPGGFRAMGKYIDVHIDDPEDVDEIEIRNYYTLADIDGLVEASLKLSWWDGIDWIECSNSGVTYPADDPTYRGYVWAIIGTDTTPNLDDLAGTAFMSMGRPPVVVVGVGGPPPAPAGTTDVRGMVSTAGVFYTQATAISEDRLCRLTIPGGTVGLTEELEPLTTITMLIMADPPPPPEAAHVIGLVYDFKPSGATFDPPVTLTFSYDPADIPEGVAEEDLVLAYYDEAAGEWLELDGCVVDPTINTITAPLSHFTAFGVLFIPTPAAFSISSLEVSSAEVEIGDTITITAVVENTGEVAGTCQVALKVNGQVEETKYVVVDPGASSTVSFTTSREAAGSYSVEVNGLVSSFTVTGKPVAPAPPELAPPAPAPPAKPGWLIPVIAISVILAIAIAVFFVRRRLGY